MKKYTFIAIFTAAVIGIFAASAFAQNDNLKFDSELAADFSKGLSGDAASLERATRKAEQILAANPKDAQTLVWLGAATLSRSGQYFMAGNFSEGGKNWKEGRRKMDEAVALDGANIDVLMTRGTTYLAASKQFPVKEEADRILKLGVSDYEKAAADKNFAHFPAAMRSEVLSGMADGFERLGDEAKAKGSYQILSSEATGETKEKAVKWLSAHQN